MKKNKVRILCLFDYKCTTGFSTVSTNIIRGLKKHFQDRLHLSIVASGYSGKDYEADQGRTSVFAAKRNDPKGDLYGRTFFLQMLKAYKYDLVFMIQDANVVLPMMPVITSLRAEKIKSKDVVFKTILYYPVDSRPIKGSLSALEEINYPVAYTEYAKKETLAQVPEIEDRLSVILHGVDTNVFNPLDAEYKKEFRQAYFGDNAGKTIIGNINRNQPRKDIPGTMLAFKHYLDHKNNNAFLYLHLDPHDQMGWNIPMLAEQIGLEWGVNYRYPLEEEMNHAQDAHYLNCIYNSLDRYLTTTTGEGFGLTILEAMACKVPVLAPDHTSISELAGGGTFMANNAWLNMDFQLNASHQDSIVRYQSNHESVASLLSVIDAYPASAIEKVECAYQFAQSLQWELINKQWVELFESAIGR